MSIRLATYRNQKHEKPVNDNMGTVYASDERLGPLEPRYSKLWKSEKVCEVDDDPFQEHAPGALTLLRYRHPIIKFP